MLSSLKNLLSGKTVILASASPRRQQLLQNIVCVCVCVRGKKTAFYRFREELHKNIDTLFLQNFPVEVVPSQFEESLDKTTFLQPWRQVVPCIHLPQSRLIFHAQVCRRDCKR